MFGMVVIEGCKATEHPLALGVNINNNFNVNANNHIDNQRLARGMARRRFILKTYKNLYRKLCTFDNITLAYEKAKRRKYNKSYIIEFEKNWKYNLCVLLEQLKNKTYEPKPLRKFILRDPKTRTISVSYFGDRIIHHALINMLEQIFEPIFIHDSYASRKGKGTLKAIERFDYFKRKVSKNGMLIKNARNKNEVKGYVLKADIKKYFESVDIEILIKIIETKVKDKDIIWLIRKILNNYEKKKVGGANHGFADLSLQVQKGMPLGNWTSQFFANVYLNELDQFVKNILKVKYYIRYVDDFVIFHKDKKILREYKEKINQFLRINLLLDLHPQKSKIRPLSRGLDFVGYRIFYYYILLRKRNRRKIEQKLHLLYPSSYFCKFPKFVL